MSAKFYYHEGKKVALVESATKTAVQYKTAPPSAQRSIFSAMLGATPNAQGVDIGDGIVVFEHPPSATASSFSASSMSADARKLEVFDGEGNTPMIVTRKFVAQFKPGFARAAIEQMNAANNVSIVQELDWLPNTYVLLVEASDVSALDMANKYQESGNVVYAQPDFVRMMRPRAIPNDALFPQQWALRNTGQGGGIPGQDIACPSAWDTTRGSGTITIAIIDEGVDYNHPDFNVPGKLVTGYDAITRTNDPNPQGNDAHGTACAGIAASAGNNGEGISGVAPGCRIMGVRIAYGTPGGGWYTSDAILADGISTAAARGADVLSNSWGGGSPSMVITSAIRNARTTGRGGKGCVVCFAAGNDNGPVSFPGNLPEVITVAACNEWGEAKTPNSKDSETWWGSNYGPEVDVCAPGVHITTTDISGARGYSQNNYTDRFNGTSAATPHVAGVAALILSMNPLLGVAAVEDILRQTADDLGGAGFDNRTGHGRVNAARAVLAASTRWGSPMQIPGWFGSEDQGGDIAIADVTGNGRPDLLVFHIDNPKGENHGYYRVGFNLDAQGIVTGGWSPVKAVPGWFGSEDQGAGVALGRLSGKLCLFVYHIDNPGGENHGYYRVGFDVNAAGDVNGGWSDIKPIPGWFGSEDQGGGIAVADLNGDGKLELIVFHIDNPKGENHGYYRIGWNLDDAGNVTGGWSEVKQIPGWFGSENQGGGIAVADVNGDGKPELIVFHIDNPGGENHGYYRVGSGINASGSVAVWSGAKIIPGWFGSENQGGGIAVTRLGPTNRVDAVVYSIDNPGGENHGYYRVGTSFQG